MPSSFLSELSTQSHTVTGPRKGKQNQPSSAWTRLILSEGLTQDDLVKQTRRECIQEKSALDATVKASGLS